jgi:hypothetical protein
LFGHFAFIKDKERKKGDRQKIRILAAILILTLRERNFKRAGTETCPYTSKNPQN